MILANPMSHAANAPLADAPQKYKNYTGSENHFPDYSKMLHTSSLYHKL
jgi:hypothetical protein